MSKLVPEFFRRDIDRVFRWTRATATAGGSTTLSDDESSSLELPVSPDEIRNAMSSLATNKSPGIDGLPVEFYRRFWTLVADDLMDVYREVLSSGRLGASQLTGDIHLFKKGDRCDLRNWRPITLPTTDYKILAKALATRLLLLGRETDETSHWAPGQTSGRRICHLDRRPRSTYASGRPTIHYMRPPLPLTALRKATPSSLAGHAPFT